MSNEPSMIDWDDAPVSDASDELEISTSHETIIIPNPNDEVAVLVQQDTEGNEVVSEINFSSPELDEHSAREITERIKTTTNVLYLLIKRAHAGKAYRALGYNSFEAYVKSEFNYSKVYAYRLLNQANFIAAIEEKVPEGTEIRVSEPVSSKLKKVLPELLEEIEERVEELEDPEDAGAVIDDILRTRREEQDNRNFLDGDDDDEIPEPPYESTGGGNGGDFNQDNDGDEWDNDLGDGFDGDDDYGTAEAENANDVRRKFDKIYNLYSGMRNLSSIGDYEELIPFLPHERYDEFQELLVEIIPMLSDFKVKFDAFLKEQEGSAPASDDDELSEIADSDEE